MLVYKQLWTVERTFRTTKSLLDTRPIYHKLDETIRGHVACSFLALVLKKELEDRLAAVDKGARASWPAVIADLDSLTETEVEQDGKRFLLRSSPRARRQPRALRPRRRPAADDAPDCGRRLIYENLRFCSATPAPQRDFARAIKNFVPGTVEDQLDRVVDNPNCASRSGIVGALARLAVGLEAEFLLLQQLADMADLVAEFVEFPDQPAQTLARPAQRRHRIAARVGLDQRVQIVEQTGVRFRKRLRPSRTANAARLQRRRGVQFLKAASDRARGDARDAGNRCYVNTFLIRARCLAEKMEQRLMLCRSPLRPVTPPLARRSCARPA